MTRPAMPRRDLRTVEREVRTSVGFGPPKKFAFELSLVPNPTVCEIEHWPGGVGKADSLSRPEFAKPLGSGSHRLCGRQLGVRGG